MFVCRCELCWVDNNGVSLQLYIRTDPSARSEETVPIIKVHQGHEPRSFKRLFPAWEDSIWEVSRRF